jgi:phosphoserine phosphatase
MFCKVVEVTFPLPNATAITLETPRRHEDMSRFEREWNTGVVFQFDNVFWRYKRLAVFDIDPALIQQEVIDEIPSLRHYRRPDGRRAKL